jgi:nucleotide-binding universal stress UspA family protein
MRVQFKHIVCATDFSDYANRTIPYGIALAKEFGSKLYICHVVDLSSIAIYGEFQLDPVGQQDRILEYAQAQLSQLLADQQIEWEPVIVVGHTAEEISRIVEDKNIDLVISATRGRTGLKRLLLGSVTERLMRTLTCPLLVVHSPEQGFVDVADQKIQLKRVLVGCDFSEDSGVAMQYGLSFAQEFEAELHLVHVVEPPTYQHMLKPPSALQEEINQELRNRLEEKLRELVPEEARNWCTPETDLLEGNAYEELTRYAESHSIDMIVLGVRGHGLVKTLLVGSTTDRVIRKSPCPVLSVGSWVGKS